MNKGNTVPKAALVTVAVLAITLVSQNTANADGTWVKDKETCREKGERPCSRQKYYEFSESVSDEEKSKRKKMYNLAQAHKHKDQCSKVKGLCAARKYCRTQGMGENCKNYNPDTGKLRHPRQPPKEKTKTKSASSSSESKKPTETTKEESSETTKEGSAGGGSGSSSSESSETSSAREKAARKESEERLLVAAEVRSSSAYAAEGAVEMTEVSEVLTAVSGRLSELRRGGVSGPATAFLSPARKAGFADGGPVASDAVTVDEELAAAALPLRRRSAGGLWFQGVGGVGRLDGGVDYDWRGMVGGLDAALFSPDLRLGVFAGGVNGGEETAYDKSETRNATAGIYGGYAMGSGWYVSGQAGWTRIRVSNRRRLDGSAGEARSDYADRVLSLRAEVSRDVSLGDGWWLEPYAGSGVDHLRLASFHESGLGGANESRRGSARVSGDARVGLRVAGRVDLDAGLALEPQFGLGWTVHLGPEATSTTLSVDDVSTPFSVAGPAADPDTATGHVGLNLVGDGGLTGYVDYTPALSAGRREHAFNVGLRIPFQ